MCFEGDQVYLLVCLWPIGKGKLALANELGLLLELVTSVRDLMDGLFRVGIYTSLMSALFIDLQLEGMLTISGSLDCLLHIPHQPHNHHLLLSRHDYCS